MEHAFREGQRAFGRFAGEGERLVLALEEGRCGGVDAAQVAMAAVAFVLEELDEDGAVLRVRINRREKGVRSRSCREWKGRWRTRASRPRERPRS